MAEKDDHYDASQSYSEQKKAEDARNSQNNANTIRNAADVAIASKNPYAAAAGTAVKAADKVTGGKSTEMLGKGMNALNKVSPGGRSVQRASNKLAESGIGDKIGTAASMKGGGGASAAEKAGDTAQKAGEAAQKAEQAKKNAENVQKMQNAADEAQKAKNVSDHTKKAAEVADSTGKANKAEKTEKSGRGRDSSLPSSDEKTEPEGDSKKGSGVIKFLLMQPFVMVSLLFVPLLIVLILVVVIVSMISGVIDDFEDAFGMSSTLGEETGELIFTSSSEEQEKFYERIQNVKLSYQAQGKTLDAMKIVAVYHALQANSVDIQYEDVTEAVIRQWADASFNGNYYDENVFRNNLTYVIFPRYKPGESQSYYEDMTDEVFDYLDRYYNLIGKESYGSSCASMGSCSYDIKGFYISGQGNIPKNIQVKDLKVRLMECGSPYGNGSYTTPIDQDLVDFEDYVAGVAYAEVGPNADEEVLKAQMVAARSFALSRPTGMGTGTGKKLAQENGKWVLQIASCVSDQVFCNIDLGCSHMGGGDGQGGICRDGKVAGAVKTVDPLPSEHALRRAAAETQGEVLVNDQGYIIAVGYNSTDQNNWSRLAASGLNYKQILLQTYNSSRHNDGATDIQKAACSSGGETGCVSTGEFSKWKQTDPQWAAVPMGSSGKNVSQIGCLVTSVSMLLAKSGVPISINPLNPGTFVQFLNQHGGINSGGNYQWNVATQAAPSFIYKGQISVEGMSREAKLNKIKEIVSQQGVYAVAEVKGNTGQHWVAIDGVNGSTINMMDPSSDATDMWAQYNWVNTSTIAYYKVG